MDVNYYITFIVSSLFVIGILLLILKWANTNQKTKGSKTIKIIDRLATGAQSSVFLIDVKGTQYLIGSTNQSVQLIDKL